MCLLDILCVEIEETERHVEYTPPGGILERGAGRDQSVVGLGACALGADPEGRAGRPARAAGEVCAHEVEGTMPGGGRSLPRCLAYVDAFPLEDPHMPWTTPEQRAWIDATPTRLCRLGYLRSLDRWQYAFYKYSDEKYALSVVASGSFEATPEQVFDCAAGVYPVAARTSKV